MRAHNAISTRGNIPCNIFKHTQLQNWKQSFGAESRTAAMLAPWCSHSQVLIWAMIIIMHKSSSLPLPFFGWTGIATPAQGCGLSLNFRALKKPSAFIIWMTENELCSWLACLELSTLPAGMQACLAFFLRLLCESLWYTFMVEIQFSRVKDLVYGDVGGLRGCCRAVGGLAYSASSGDWATSGPPGRAVEMVSNCGPQWLMPP